VDLRDLGGEKKKPPRHKEALADPKIASPAQEAAPSCHLPNN
jgi:hypothetical protein